jgi:hypothetical protein
MKNDKKMQKLITEMIGEDDDERRVFLADNILETDPDNGIAKYVKWQSANDESALGDNTLLQEAVASLKPEVENLEEHDGDAEMLHMIYVSMLSDLASSFYITGEKDKAFEAASEFMRLDRECTTMGRLVYFASLADRGDFEELLDSVETDICETSSGEHCRAIAAFETKMTEAPEYLLNAISLDPDLTCYMLGIWGVDEIESLYSDDSDGYAEEIAVIVSILTELWSANDERLGFLSSVAFAFGYLTRRVESYEDTIMLERTYREAGCLEKMLESRDILDAMLAEGREQQEVDESALSIIRESEYFGLLD